MGVELLDGCGPVAGTKASQTPNTMGFSQAVRLRGISSVVERETAQIDV